MHLTVERYIGVLDDYTVLFLQCCHHCHALITYEGQGHHCDGVIEGSALAQQEAADYVQLMRRVKKIYTLPDFNAPKQ
jgi:hypothetical protein